jgi:hypothetical protein
MTSAATEARKLLATNIDEDKARFASSIGPATPTSDLLAMLEAAKLKDREREEAIARRRAELSKEAFARRREEERAMIEEPEPPKWVGPAPWELAAAAREAQKNQAPISATDERSAGATREQPPSSPVAQQKASSHTLLPSPLPPAPPASSSFIPENGSHQGDETGTAPFGTSKSSPFFQPPPHQQQGDVAMVPASEFAAMKKSYEMKLESLNDLLTSMQSRNEQLESDKQVLSAQLAEARAKVDELDQQLLEKMKPKAMIDRGQLITKEELAEVRQEIAMQERIVKVLEKENEVLIGEKKAMTQKIKAIEKGQMESDAKQSLNSGRHPLASTSAISPPSSLNTSAVAAVPSPSVAELNLQLQRSKTTEAELRVELDTLKKQKKDLEMKFATVDLQLVEEAKLEARNAKANLKRKDMEYSSNVADMARKIAWYVEHQEFNTAQADLLKEREATIHSLRLKLHEMESLVTKSGVVRTDKDRQIKNLQRRALELEDALRAKNPDSITELIRSVQPSFEQSARFKQLESVIEDLKAQLQSKDKECEGIVDRLRVESDRLRSAYQQRIEKLEDEMKMRVLNAQSRKVKELEKTLVDTRKYYTEKVKELEHSVVLLRRGISTPPGAGVSAPAQSDGQQAKRPAAGARRSPGSSQAKKVESAEESLEEEGRAGAAPNQPLEQPAPPSTNSNKHTSSSVNLAPALLSLQNENLELKKQLDAMIQQTAALVSTPSVAAASFGLASSLQAQLSSLAAELSLHKRLLAEAQEMTRKTHSDWEDRLLSHRREAAKELQLLRTEHDSEVLRLHARHDAETKALLAQKEELLRQVATARGGGGVATADRLSSKGVQGYLEAVAVKLQLLEHRQLAREAETEREIGEIRRVAAFETALERQKLQLAVEEKNQEILAFKGQLDQLLGDLAQLRYP